MHTYIRKFYCNCRTVHTYIIYYARALRKQHCTSCDEAARPAAGCIWKRSAPTCGWWAALLPRWTGERFDYQSTIIIPLLWSDKHWYQILILTTGSISVATTTTTTAITNTTTTHYTTHNSTTNNNCGVYFSNWVSYFKLDDFQFGLKKLK